MYSIRLGLNGLHLNAADPSAFFNAYLDVALVSPSHAPGVFHKVILLTDGGGTITNSKNTVVKIDTTTLGDDTRSVVLEDVLVSFNSHGSWPLSDRSLELVDAERGDLTDFGDFNGGL